VSAKNQRENSKTKKYKETKENTMVQDLWDEVQAVLTGKLVVIQVYLEKPRTISNNLSLHLKKQRKNKQSPKSVEKSK